MSIEFVFGTLSFKVATSFAWLIANWAYLDFRRTGDGGFKRLVAFWMGWPMTFVTAMLVKNGSQPQIRLDDRNLDELVDEIRRDRLLRERSDRGRALPPEGDLPAGGVPRGQEAA